MPTSLLLTRFCSERIQQSKIVFQLPPGYDWETQIYNYCPPDLAFRLDEIKKGDRYPWPLLHKFGYVFCHRGLYEHAMKIPENSILAIANGVENRNHLLLHEIDVRMDSNPDDAFLAHDEVANRVTSKACKWTLLNISEIKKTPLVMRRYDEKKDDYASSYQETNEKVPSLIDVLHAYRRYWGEAGEDWLYHDSCSFQPDLRGNDFPRAIVHFQTQAWTEWKVFLKGNNFDFASFQDLKAAVSSNSPFRRGQYMWSLTPSNPHYMMVFYSKPLIALALKAKGMDPDTADHSSLDFQDIYDIVMQQVRSFIKIPDGDFTPRGDFILEIAHSGLGLGYNKQTEDAVNPLDGTAIKDPEVIFESRVDRAMIDFSLDLRREYPELLFSSCTRLCEVSTSRGELVADIKTGRLKPKPDGEEGISTKLRSIHGGLFPQSDLVVADDPYAEIAARTWVDEYAKLDRSQLLQLSYSDWLAQAGPTVVTAVNNLDGPFLPNKFDGPQDDSWNI